VKPLAGSFYQSWSIAHKIAVAMILAVIIPMTAAAYLNLQQVTAITTNGEYRQLELLASNAAQRFDRLLLKRQHLAEIISHQADVVRYMATPQTTLSVLPQLTNMVESYRDIEAILLLDPQGNCLTATMHQFVGHRYHLPAEEVFSRLRSNVRDYPGMFVTHHLTPNTQSGAVLLKLRGVEMWSVVNRGLPPKTAGQFFLIDEQGTIISHPHLSLLYQKVAAVTPNWPQLVNSMSSGHFRYQPSPGRMPQIIGFTTLITQPWMLGVSQSLAEFQAPLSDITWLNLQGMAGVGGVAALMAMLLGICISRPIQGLTIAAQSLEQDENDAGAIDRIHQDLMEFAASPDDLGQLVRSFLKMVDEQHRRDRQLKTQVQSLRIEIDRHRLHQDVAEITDSEQFQQLQRKIRQLRNHERSGSETETDYFQRLQGRVQSLKERADPMGG
jgi:hypothetical protein